MKIKRMAKRLFAVGTGLTMLGATAMGALAAVDLNNYPNFFVSNGTFNGFIVVGEKAASVDNLAATDIAANMFYAGAEAAAATTVSGDAWMVATSAKKYEMANSNATISGEQLYDVEQFIGKTELAALADGTYSTNAGSSTYVQYLYFDVKNNELNEIVKYVKDDKDVTADFFYVKNGLNIGQYVLEFSSAPESTIQDTAGSVSATGTVLNNYENTKVSILGKTYDIVLARRPQAKAEDSIKLTLMGGASSSTLLEGESSSVQVNGKSYDVALTFVDQTYAKFTVNGQQTDKLQVGDTYKLSDGTEVGVSEILYQNYAGGVHSADFFVGASKIELRDNVITDTESSNALKEGTETITGADVVIEGTDDNTTFTISKIRVNMTAQDDYFVAVGKKLSEAIVDQGDDKELIFTNNWDISYLGLDSSVKTHDVKLFSNTDRKYRLQFYDGDNNAVDFPLFYAYNSSHLITSEDGTKRVLLNEAFNISKDDYFAITGGTPSQGTAKSFGFAYKGADKSTATSPKIKFKNLGTGESLEYSVDTTSGTDVCTLKMGGYSFLVQNTSSKASSDFSIRVDMDASGAVGANTEIDLVDYYGLVIDFEGLLGRNETGHAAPPFIDPLNATPTNITLWHPQIDLSVPNTNDYDNFAPPVINITVTGTATNEVTIASLNMSASGSGTGGQSYGQSLITPTSEENIAYGYTTMGGKMTYTTPSGSPATFTYEYPEKQKLPQVYVTSGAVATATTSKNLSRVSVVDATKLDSEITSATSQNLIVIGGPCVNTVAASLLGNPTDCTQGFKPGVSRVKLFEHANGNVAMLVAGYSGADTRLAGQVITHRYKDLSGTEVEIEGTTYGDATIGAPKPVVVAVPAATTTTTGSQ